MAALFLAPPPFLPLQLLACSATSPLFSLAYPIPFRRKKILAATTAHPIREALCLPPSSKRCSISEIFPLFFFSEPSPTYPYDRLPPPPTHSVPAYTSRGSSSSVDICLRIQADFFGSLSGGPFPSPPSSPPLLPPLWQPHRRWERSLRQTPLDDSSRRGSLSHHPWGKRGRIV